MGTVLGRGTNQETGFTKGLNWALVHGVKKKPMPIIQITRQTVHYHCFDQEQPGLLVESNQNSLEDVANYIKKKYPANTTRVTKIYFAHPMEGLKIPEESEKRAFELRALLGNGYEVWIPEEHQVGLEKQQVVDLKAVYASDIVVVDFWRMGSKIA